ncbi:hypothetical protein SEA_OPIE_58 [Gordonia phage Opie]|nr:hypothetical protein SEA_OPIE_58 [Gordonia phage Opie]
MSTEHNPRPGEPWLIRSVTSSYKATAILRMKPNTTDAFEWVIVAEDGRSSIGAAELPDGWVLIGPVLPRQTSTTDECKTPAALAIIQQVREYIDRSEHRDSWGVPCVYTKDLRRILDGGGA